MTTSLTQDDPDWIGAWWLGCIICAFLVLLSAIPILPFPKRLPALSVTTKDFSNTNGVRMEQSSNEDKTETKTTEAQSNFHQDDECDLESVMENSEQRNNVGIDNRAFDPGNETLKFKPSQHCSGQQSASAPNLSEYNHTTLPETLDHSSTLVHRDSKIGESMLSHSSNAGIQSTENLDCSDLKQSNEASHLPDRVSQSSEHFEDDLRQSYDNHVTHLPGLPDVAQNFDSKSVEQFGVDQYNTIRVASPTIEKGLERFVRQNGSLHAVNHKLAGIKKTSSLKDVLHGSGSKLYSRSAVSIADNLADETDVDISRKLVENPKEMLREIIQLLRNPVFVFTMLAFCCELYQFPLYYYFMPKYLEVIYNLPSSTSSIINGEHRLTFPRIFVSKFAYCSGLLITYNLSYNSLKKSYVLLNRVQLHYIVYSRVGTGANGYKH